MEALTTPPTRLFTTTTSATTSSSSNHGGDDQFWSSRTRYRSFFPFPKLNSISLLRSSSFSSNKVHVANVGVVTAESTYDKSKRVHVKFQLQKECLFGEQFLLVGDDPAIALWDPATAIPLEWSQQHIWTVELDLPLGKPIHFKFILKGATEQIFWQPGPDRILETWETMNTIVVSEDWENGEIQKITEEPRSKLDNEASPNIDLVDAWNIPHSEEEDEEPMHTYYSKDDSDKEDITSPGKESIVDESNSNLYKATITTEEHRIDKELNEGPLFAENMVTTNGNVAANEKSIYTQDGDLYGYVGEAVLVPGLTPLPKGTTEEVIPIKPQFIIAFEASFVTDETEGLIPLSKVTTEEVLHVKPQSEIGFEAPFVTDETEGLVPLSKVTTEEFLPVKPESKTAFQASFVTDETEDPGLPESSENREHEVQKVDGIPNQEEATLKMINEVPHEEGRNDDKQQNDDELNGENQLNVAETVIHYVLGDDFQWGKKTWQRLLTVLGFSLDKT